MLWPSAWMAKTLSGIPGHTKASFPLAHLRQRHRRYTAAGGPGDGHLHDRDLRKGADTMAKRRKPGSGNQIGDHLWEGRYSPGGPDGKQSSRNICGHTPEECEEKLRVLIAAMKAQKRNSRGCGRFSCLWYFCGQSKTPKKSGHCKYAKKQRKKNLISREIRFIFGKDYWTRISELLRVKICQARKERAIPSFPHPLTQNHFLPAPSGVLINGRTFIFIRTWNSGSQAELLVTNRIQVFACIPV